ncbi:hypothetical protein ACUWC2_28830, partial [Klebsiella pneumoniae]|uniref:hypothetical protein n=1 Tax=Klebsiella pneumoniae TaxID=573 RepID=UPI0040558EDE
ITILSTVLFYLFAFRSVTVLKIKRMYAGTAIITMYHNGVTLLLPLKENAFKAFHQDSIIL